MNARDGYDEQPDYDGHDEPRGTDPKLRRDAGHYWFNHNGSWYQIDNNGNLPEGVLRSWVAEEMLRDRAEKKARV